MEDPKVFKSKMLKTLERMAREGKTGDVEAIIDAAGKLVKKYKIRYTAQEKIKKVDKVPRVFRYLFK